MLGAPLLVLCFILFFNPPASLAAGSAFSYMLLMYILTGTLDSLINANYGALFPELFRTEAERAKTNAMRQVFQLIAMVVSIALTPMVTDAIGFSATAILYGVLAVAVIWFMSLGCHEDPAAMERRSHGCSGAFSTSSKTRNFGFTALPTPPFLQRLAWCSPACRSM